MSALIAMCCFDTEENNRSWMTAATLMSLAKTVDLSKHELYVVDNNSCQKTKDLLRDFQATMNFNLITNEKNLGTAEAINLAWRNRKPGQHCIKLDNDVVIHHSGWVEEMKEAIERDPSIGQVALKRTDLWETPWHENPFYRSELYMLPHKPGERWVVVESASHCIGTCLMHSSDLLDKVGYLKQPGVYGLEDSLMSHRSKIAGFKNVFLPHIPISHIDSGGGEYQSFKERIAGESWAEYQRLLNGYQNGYIPIYYNPFENL